MQYFAKVNTAGPKTGFISVGEMLTDRQVEALGSVSVQPPVGGFVVGFAGLLSVED